MPRENQFGLFSQDEKGPLWRTFFSDLEEARRKAQKLADLEGLEFFIYDFELDGEVARFYPRSQEPGAPEGR